MSAAPVGAAALRAIAGAVGPDAGWSAWAAAARELDRLPPERRAGALAARVALLGSFTLPPLAPVLRVEAARQGLWLDVHVGEYGQYLQELLDTGSALHRFRPDVTFVAIDSDVLWNLRWSGGVPRSSADAVEALLGPLCRGLEEFQSRTGGRVVVNDFALPRPSTEGVNAFRSKGTFAHTINYANKRLRLELAERGASYLFPFADVVGQIGRDHAWNWRTHYQAHLTWSVALMRAVARRWAGYAAAGVGRATKCLVLDLDDTLWGGVLGEAGPDGIALGPGWPGREYLDFQRELLDLQRQGILLALASKNNEAEVLQVLREHPHQLIREHHLAAWRVDWGDKAGNIRALAAELNIGLDAMLFIDDSPHERAWVRREIPELEVPDPPGDPARWPEWIGTLPSLIVLQQTAEDLLRTGRYHAERERRRARATQDSLDAFLASLDLSVRIAPMTGATLPRVAQLLGKTNQFNLTTRRHDERTLWSRVEEGRWRVYTMEVRDTFGDFGLTGVAVVEPGADWHLDSFLMSCRVIGKGVESALLAAIAADARAAGAGRLTAEFRDSGRNAPARDFLPAHGFVAEGGRWVRPLDPLPAWPAHVRRDGAPEPSVASQGDHE